MIKEQNRNLIGGLVLVAVGLVALVGQITDIDWLKLLFVPALGIIFLVWGILSREAGPIIPGGILSGIGTGIILLQVLDLSEPVSGGVFMFAFAGGWVLITLLTALFAEETHWWALIPGAIMALIGTAAMGFTYAETVFELLGQAWPVFLILLGLFILFRSRSKTT